MVFTEGAMGFSHTPGGSHALFRDGHLELIRRPGEFPIRERFAMT
jgi:hypothetical protein